jgi:predicted metal-dependent peptidase
MLHVILDTSGSMVDEIPKALGAIADFCEAVGAEQIRVIQCDASVAADETLSPAELARWTIKGFGGSDLAPAMRRLAEEREVEAAVVLTDGDIEYPKEAVPYNVLWVLPASSAGRGFAPTYGQVMTLN